MGEQEYVKGWGILGGANAGQDKILVGPWPHLPPPLATPLQMRQHIRNLSRG